MHTNFNNIEDYIRWRGDLDFKQAPFNDIDNLILSQIAYVDMSDYIPPVGSNMCITLGEVAREFFAHHTEDELRAVRTFSWEAPFLLRTAGEYPRFANILLRDYRKITDGNRQVQFSAYTAELSDKTLFVAYTGTDDTILGWREDFNMSYIYPLPGQVEAANYLNLVTAGIQPTGKSPWESFKDLTNNTDSPHKLLVRGLKIASTNAKRIRVGGHSKGGNLAVYAAAFCHPRVQKRIIAVYNNDGPGFLPEVLSQPSYINIKPVIRRIVPDSSLIGMLLWHDVTPTIIHSSAHGLLAHDPMSWEVLGTSFVGVSKLKYISESFGHGFNSWIEQVSFEDRERFVDSLFNIIDATGATTLSELTQNGLASVSAAIKEYVSMPKAERDLIKKLLTLLISQEV